MTRWTRCVGGIVGAGAVVATSTTVFSTMTVSTTDFSFSTITVSTTVFSLSTITVSTTVSPPHAARAQRPRLSATTPITKRFLAFVRLFIVDVSLCQYE